jgi:hypothetical protein
MSVEGEVIAKIGQEVTPVQVVARAPVKMDFQVVPVCDLLHISPEELAENLLISKGTPVDQGTPLVKKRGFRRKEFLSPVDGTLYEVVNGRLVFQRISEFMEIRALSQGRVVNRIGNLGVVLEINGSRIQAVWDSGKEGFGKIHVAVDSAVTSLSTAKLSEDVINQVLIVGKIDRAEQLDQAEYAGIGGLITGSIAGNLLTKASSVNYPVFVTDGIGDQGMASPIFQLLQKAEGQEIALYKRKANQPGARPEIIIPMAAIPGEELPPAGKPLEVGQTVRILRPPFNNQVGVVAQMYEKSRFTSIGTRAISADIKLADGQVVMVPLANLDAIV